MLSRLRAAVGRQVDVRAQIVASARWGIAHEPSIHYTETSGRDDWLAREPKQLEQLPLSTDCSGFFTFCYRVAGALDPNGLAYRVLGYTGTLMGHGRSIPRGQMLPGDAVIWGKYPGVHVAMALDVGAHDLMSHGQESGPALISFDAENAYHAARGHLASFWRFPTTVLEQAAHVPAGFVQPHPAPVAKKKTAALPARKKKAKNASNTSAVHRERKV